MTNDELKALCERIMQTSLGKYDSTVKANDLKPKIVALASECLRLLKENEVMQGVVKAAKDVNCGAGTDCMGYGFIALEEALSKLESK